MLVLGRMMMVVVWVLLQAISAAALHLLSVVIRSMVAVQIVRRYASPVVFCLCRLQPCLQISFI